ncbi:hypothetical protein FGO68_gene9400 [Halteria grandinella]|uniref:Ribosome maturation protein SBDS n=1 Tax=Halteria grandinella TaxID=5974 RepID=A0A8J8NMI2_HALGN|nr:hypothetical protein FGO68_gene9400 [Halteria grandinella]
MMLNYQLINFKQILLEMSQAMKNPVNQVRMTNVAYIKLKKGGKRFELACYKNKILDWRNKRETNIDEVLQIDQIFTNASKGDVAKKTDLLVFGEDLTKEQIILEILNKGEVQVSELERGDHLDSLKKDIANIIVSKCINTKDGKQFPVSIILKAMSEVNCKINPTQNSKKQALDFIKDLQKVIPIERAKMKLKIAYENDEQRAKLVEILNQDHKDGEDFTIERMTEKFMELMIQPHLYRDINTIHKKDKEFFANVSIEIQDSQVGGTDEHDDDEDKPSQQPLGGAGAMKASLTPAQKDAHDSKEEKKQDKKKKGKKGGAGADEEDQRTQQLKLGSDDEDDDWQNESKKKKGKKRGGK